MNEDKDKEREREKGAQNGEKKSNDNKREREIERGGKEGQKGGGRKPKVEKGVRWITIRPLES